MFLQALSPIKVMAVGDTEARIIRAEDPPFELEDVHARPLLELGIAVEVDPPPLPASTEPADTEGTDAAPRTKAKAKA